MESGPADPEREPCEAACDPAGNGEPGPAGEPSSCRAREVLQRVGDKWSMYVIDLLGQGTMRFTELHRATRRLHLDAMIGVHGERLDEARHARVVPRAPEVRPDLAEGLGALPDAVEALDIEGHKTRCEISGVMMLAWTMRTTV